MENEEVSIAGLLGRCPAMERLRREVALFGPSDVRVHVFGETGTGKERVAKALHEASPRARRRIVPVNVAGFSDDLLVAELFGHARGAFTGAVAARDGYVAEAEGSTLFIDEVGDMSPLAQVRLLRFLEGGEYRRLGETVARKADVRVISATNVDLERRVREGRFREDLWFRLAGELVWLPPLRERGTDVLLLARHFLREFARKFQKRFHEITPAAAQMFRDYAWPGNVRELRNLIERVVLLEEGQRLLPDHLPAEFTGRKSAASEAPGAAKEAIALPTLAQIEAEHIGEVLRLTAGNKSRAARILGISRQGLIEKLRRLRLEEGAGRQVS
jgi:DNA-binding NtrC family response regulator